MLKRLIQELRRRNVLPTVLPYIAFVWLILQVVVVIQPLLNLHPLVSTFVTIVLFALFPVVLYLSWYFDFTMEGLLPIKNIDGETPSKFGKRRWATLFFIMLGSGYLGFAYFNVIKIEMVKQEEGVAQVKLASSIAVIPFRDQSPEQGQAFISYGLAEELTSLLGKISGLQVSASSSAILLYEQNLTPFDIGRRLAVDAVVSGSLRVTGNKMKIRTELVDISNGKILWSETFNREFNDIFAVEEEIARSIVNLLDDRFLERGEVTSQAKTASTDAYVMYLKGREAYRKQTTESMKESRKYFEQAIALDPEYALAYVGLADAIAMLASGASATEGVGHDAFFGVIDKNIASRLVHDNIAKALVRSPDLAEAYAVRGLVLSYLDDNNIDALSSFNKALSLNPNLASAYSWKFAMFDAQGQYEQGWNAIEKAYELDPISRANQYNRALYQFRRGDSESALNGFTELINDFPESPFGYSGLANIFYNKGKYAKSVENWLIATALSPNNKNYQLSLAETLTQMKLTELARRLVDDPDTESTYLLVEEDYDTLFADLEFQLSAYPDDPWIKFEAGWYYLIRNDVTPLHEKKGIALLLEAYSQLAPEELFTPPLCSPAIEIAWALKRASKHAEALKLLETCKSQTDAAKASNIKDSFVDYTDARIEAIQNDTQKANEALSLAVKRGWLQWWTKNDPLIQAVLNTEQGSQTLQEIEKRITAERINTLAQFEQNSPP